MGSDWHSRIGAADVHGDGGDHGDRAEDAESALRGSDRSDSSDSVDSGGRNDTNRVDRAGWLDSLDDLDVPDDRAVDRRRPPEVRHPLTRFYVDDPDDIFAGSHDGAVATATEQAPADTDGTDDTDETDGTDGTADAGIHTPEGVVVRAGAVDRTQVDRRPERRAMALDDEVGAGLTARDALEGFDPAGANRADVGLREARTFVAVRTSEQPRLATLVRQEHCVQRIYAVFGQGAFHGTERHEGAMRDRDHLLRLLERHDPAQTDEERQARGIDAFKRGNGKHVCADSSTSIGDSVAYAVALARGVDHPKVRDALAARHDPPRRPHYVQVPIVELLGQEGHEYCSGYELVGDDPRRAVKERDVWAKAGWRGKPRDDLREPRARQITTFQDGVIEFRFEHNAAYDGYELVSMFPRPHADPVGGRRRRGQQP